MRKIEQQMLDAIDSGRNWHSGNTRVEQRPVIAGLEVEVTLHGHLIAKGYFRGEDRPGRWEVTLAGWDTATTRSRLSAIVRHVSRLGPDGLGVSSRKGQPYLHDYAGKRPIDCWGWHLVTA